MLVTSYLQGMQHISNLYSDQTVLLFKRCYAMEKIHGTSANIKYKLLSTEPHKCQITFSSGGAKAQTFAAIFDALQLQDKFRLLGHADVCVYGEAYGGSMQKMRDAYGDELKFIVFEVRIGDCWLDVPNAAEVALKLGLEFVHYENIPTDMAAIDAQRDAYSVQAVRNGCGKGKMREGVVLRPLIELTMNNGVRVVAKHKRDDFRETRTPRKVSPEQLTVLKEADDIALEWVTDRRLEHVLDAFPGVRIQQTRDVIHAMIEDVYREGENEIVKSPAAAKAIGKRTAAMLKALLRKALLT